MQTLKVLSEKWNTVNGAAVGFEFKSVKTGKIFKTIAQSPGGKFLVSIVDDPSGKFEVGEEMLLSSMEARYIFTDAALNMPVVADFSELNAKLDKVISAMEALSDTMSDLEIDIQDIEADIAALS